MPAETTTRPDTPDVGEASDWAVHYAQDMRNPFEPSEPGKVRITLLTDPWSVWCWGLEPVRRTIELRYPTLEFRNLLGGMFEDVPDPARAGFDIHRFFTVVQRTTGMPIHDRAAADDAPGSTFPACIAVHAFNLVAPGREAEYLRAMREAAYLDAQNISSPDVAMKVAEGLGVRAAELREALDSGEPEREFRERMAMLERLDLYAYPTLLFSAGEKTARVDGFQALPNVLTVAESVSGRLHPSTPPPDDVVDVLLPGERVATREVAEVIGQSVEATAERLAEAADEGRLDRERHETGDVWRRVG